ncbi:MAG TPA: hypothetical protein VE173_01545 [Longimicrobiales bacterium]|nr:hypothetical protein [Longimicrobiales bacterium]
MRMGARAPRRPWIGASLAAGILCLLLLTAGPALAAGPTGSVVRISVPGHAALGQVVQVRARLLTTDGHPIPAARLTFTAPVSWAGGTEYTGQMSLGSAETNDAGVAVLSLRMTSSGPIAITARFAGTEGHPSASATSSPIAVSGDAQLYTPQAGIRVPWIGPWLLLLLIALLYGLYVLVATRVFAISHSPSARWLPAGAPLPVAGTGSGRGHGPRLGRREFFGRVAVPGLMGAAATTVGLGLDTIIGRSPHTHANLADYTTSSTYHRTAFQRVGTPPPAPKLPPVLDRPVSFEKDVRPILVHRAGPHVVLPENQPPPKGIRLDDYDAIVSYESLVVPGKPERSGLVSVLVDPAMHMPPSLPSLPKEEIQIIVSWIAQGAKR